MSQVEVKPVTTKAERKAFVNFAWKLYAGDPNWMPPLRMNQEELLGFRQHPFYDDAEIQTFLAYRGGEVVGRVAAIVNHAHNRRFNEQRGFFGFFESIDDQAVASALFDQARWWLASRDIHAIRGPANPSQNYECGLLIDAFDKPPTFMMTYNRPYYGQLIEGWGFTKSHDLLAFWGRLNMLSNLDPKLFFISAEAAKRFGVKSRTLDKKRFAEELRMFLRVYNDSMAGTWGFVPLSEAEITALGTSLKHLIVPEIAMVAEIEGKPIGAVFGLLDYNPRIKAINGRLFPFGFLKLLWNKRKIKKMRVISINVVPEYQMWGLGLVVLGSLVKPMQNWGIDEIEFSWVLESNHLSRRTLEKGGAILQKTYRIYDWVGEKLA